MRYSFFHITVLILKPLGLNLYFLIFFSSKLQAPSIDFREDVE